MTVMIIKYELFGVLFECDFLNLRPTGRAYAAFISLFSLLLVFPPLHIHLSFPLSADDGEKFLRRDCFRPVLNGMQTRPHVMVSQLTIEERRCQYSHFKAGFSNLLPTSS